MKTPQRKFVVEFKSPRRQSKTPPNSIWGDTDLKALAREIDEQQSDLSYPGHTRHAVSAGEVTSSLVLDTGSAVEPAIAGDVVQVASVAADNSATDGSADLNAEQQGAVSVGAAQDDVRSSRPRKVSKRAFKPRLKRREPEEDSKDQTAQSNTATEPASLDEIAALDAENKRLKLLLAEHLRKQNLQLKQMLGRFDLS